MPHGAEYLHCGAIKLKPPLPFVAGTVNMPCKHVSCLKRQCSLVITIERRIPEKFFDLRWSQVVNGVKMFLDLAALVRLFIENEIGFFYEPIFSMQQ